MTDQERPDIASEMNETAVEEVLRGVFRQQDPGPEPSSFERIFGNARREAADRAERKNVRQRPLSWNLAYGLLAVAVVVVLFEPWDRFEKSFDAPSGDVARQLVADLSRSTRWVAPSDGWLRKQPAGVGELPDFHGLKFTMQETLPWPEFET